MRAFLEASQGIGDLPEFIGLDTPGYFRTGANIRVEGIKFCTTCNDKPGRVFISIRGSNLFDIRYRYPTYTINRWAYRGTPGRRRQVLVTLGYKF